MTYPRSELNKALNFAAKYGCKVSVGPSDVADTVIVRVMNETHMAQRELTSLMIENSHVDILSVTICEIVSELTGALT